MTPENGRKIRIEYIRSMLKRTNITFRKNHRNPDAPTTNDVIQDKPKKTAIKLRRPVSLDENFVSVKPPEKTVTFREPITVSGNLTMARKQSQSGEKSASSQRATSETKPRSKFDSNTKETEVVEDRPRPRTYERAETSQPKFGTIRKTYEPNKKFRPLAVFRAFEQKPETVTEPSYLENELTRENGLSPGSEIDSELSLSKQMDINIPIATFPFVEDNELEKHKKMNAEADRLSKQRSPGPYDSYLKRLKLERKALEPGKPKEQPKVKKKPLFKRIQTKPRFIKEVKDELFERPDQPPPRSKEERASRIMLDFKYSHAVEQYYGNQMRHNVNFSPMSDSFVNYSYGDET